MRLIIERTADGSPTLYREDLDEHYHSVKGAVAEGQHVYIETGWKAAIRPDRPVTVFEIGFGSGLNAALTARAAQDSNVKTIYYSIELYPLPEDTVRHLAADYDEALRNILLAVNDTPWGEEAVINQFFTLHKIQADLLTASIPGHPDAVYFDAFAPEKQPEMWSGQIFAKLFDAMNPGGVLTTYCAKGAIRRLLNATGFTVERLPGPPGGKREILRASKPGSSQQSQ